MSKTVQFKRGNANVSATYVGAQGELTVNTDNYTLNVHDGITPGGYSILNSNVSNIGNLVVNNQTITGTVANTNITLSPTNANVVLTSNLITPNIAINRYTISSVQSGSSLTLPATSDATDVALTNNFSNIKLSVFDGTTNAPYTLVLDTNSYLTLPGYIKSNLGGAEIQFAGTQGMLFYANFATGRTGITLDDVGLTEIFANTSVAITTDYAGAGRRWTFNSNGTLSSPGNLAAANLLISHTVANNTVQARTLANSDLQLSATNGTQISSIYLWANNQRMSFNTVSNAFDFNFNGQLSATDFTASKNSAYGYSFYAEGSGYSGFRHTSGPPDYISIDHEGNVFTKFFSNGTTDIIGNLRVTSDGVTYGTFPDAYVQVYSNVNSYSQFVLQNISDGESASTDVVLTSDNGNDASYYVDLGITSSDHTDPDFFGDTTAINDAYLYVTGYDQVGPSLGNVGNLIIGSTNGVVKTFIGNTAEANVVTIVNSTGLLPGANVVYNLGSEANQWKDLWLSNSTIYLGGVPITVTANGQLSVNGSVISGDTSNYGNANVAAYLTSVANVKIGFSAGFTNQGFSAVAIGSTAASNNQGNYAIAIGATTAQNNQGNNSVAIGTGAAAANQGIDAIAIGTGAGGSFQGNGAVAIGSGAGGSGGSDIATVAIGDAATVDGNYSIAIGRLARVTSASTIMLNATGNVLNSYGAGFYVDPIGSGTTGNILYYDTSTKKITYGAATGSYSNSNVSAYLPTYTGNIAANIVKNGYTWTFDNEGKLTFPVSSTSIFGGIDNDFTIDTAATSGPTYTFTFTRLGSLSVPINIDVSGNVNTHQIVGPGAGNVTITANTQSWLFDNNGMLTLPSDSQIRTVGNTGMRLSAGISDATGLLLNNTSDAELYANANVSIYTGAGNTGWTFDYFGNVTIPGSINAVFATSPSPRLSGFDVVGAQIISANNITVLGNITAGNISSNVNGFAIGYRDIPQVVFTSNATLALTDAGKHYFSSNSANVITVPNNSTVSFNIGAAVTIVQQGTANLTITPDSGVTMYLSGNSTSAARTLGNYGMATLMKVATDTWFINGTGLV